MCTGGVYLWSFGDKRNFTMMMLNDDDDDELLSLLRVVQCVRVSKQVSRDIYVSAYSAGIAEEPQQPRAVFVTVRKDKFLVAARSYSVTDCSPLSHRADGTLFHTSLVLFTIAATLI